MGWNINVNGNSKQELLDALASIDTASTSTPVDDRIVKAAGQLVSKVPPGVLVNLSLQGHIDPDTGTGSFALTVAFVPPLVALEPGARLPLPLPPAPDEIALQAAVDAQVGIAKAAARANAKGPIPGAPQP